MEYSVTVWRAPVREGKEVLCQLTFRREWIVERLERCARAAGAGFLRIIYEAMLGDNCRKILEPCLLADKSAPRSAGS